MQKGTQTYDADVVNRLSALSAMEYSEPNLTEEDADPGDTRRNILQWFKDNDRSALAPTQVEQARQTMRQGKGRGGANRSEGLVV